MTDNSLDDFCSMTCTFIKSIEKNVLPTPVMKIEFCDELLRNIQPDEDFVMEQV